MQKGRVRLWGIGGKPESSESRRAYLPAERTPLILSLGKGSVGHWENRKLWKRAREPSNYIRQEICRAVRFNTESSMDTRRLMHSVLICRLLYRKFEARTVPQLRPQTCHLGSNWITDPNTNAQKTRHAFHQIQTSFSIPKRRCTHAQPNVTCVPAGLSHQIDCKCPLNVTWSKRIMYFTWHQLQQIRKLPAWLVPVRPK